MSGKTFSVQRCANIKCFKLFTPTSPSQYFCTPECRNTDRAKRDDRRHKLYQDEHKSPAREKTMKRLCLGCGKTFVSSGPSNRICLLCKRTQSRDDASRTYDYNFKGTMH